LPYVVFQGKEARIHKFLSEYGSATLKSYLQRLKKSTKN